MPFRCGPKVSPLNITVDPQRCMGDWYVQSFIPASSLLESP
eukprot:gene5445-5448_t